MIPDGESDLLNPWQCTASPPMWLCSSDREYSGACSALMLRMLCVLRNTFAACISGDWICAGVPAKRLETLRVTCVLMSI